MKMLTLLAIVCEFTGTILIAYTVLTVHHRMFMEKKIDKNVRRAIQAEQIAGFFGVGLLTMGLIFSLIALFSF